MNSQRIKTRQSLRKYSLLLLLAYLLYRFCVQWPQWNGSDHDLLARAAFLTPMKGKAFIISTKAELSTDIRRTAVQCGFIPILFPATQPIDRFYKSKYDLTAKCLNIGSINLKRGKVYELMSLAEISLICSHRRALERIANDTYAEESDWTLILEDDARVVPSLSSDNPLSLSVVDEALKYALARGTGFVFFGLCKGRCLKIDGTVGVDCTGFCTHAFAVTKRQARHLYADIYAKKEVLQIDQAIQRHFKNRQGMGAVVAGWNFESPFDSEHKGLLYQCCRGDIAVGSNLPHQNKILNGTTYTMIANGRMGNLMFQYAALAGICKLHNSPAELCAILERPSRRPGQSLARYEQECPVQPFLDAFQLGLPPERCKPHSGMYAEHAERPLSIEFDARVLEQQPETLLVGWFQSYKYFHPHAEETVRNLFTFSQGVSRRASSFLHKMQSSHSSEYQLVALCIRRGDKTNQNAASIYNKWALSSDYYLAAIDFFRKKYSKLSVVVFFGGSFTSANHEEDKRWVEVEIFARFEGSTEVKMINALEMQYDAVVSLCAISLFPNIIVASSSYSWWAAYIAGHSNVVVPNSTQNEFVRDDYYLPTWHVLGS